MHRRVGAIEIPTVESFKIRRDSPKEKNEEGKSKTAIRPVETEVVPAVQGQANFDNIKWNMTTLGLVYYIDKLQRTPILIS